MHAEMQACARAAEKYLGEGITLLYSEDRSRVYKEKAPEASAAFSRTIEALLKHEARNPELYEMPAVVAGMLEYRARAYKERATSYLIQGKLDLYVSDLKKVVNTAEDLKPKLAAVLDDPGTIDKKYLGDLRGVQTRLVGLEGNAYGALGLHYMMTGDKEASDMNLKRALEILPDTDPLRGQLMELMKEQEEGQ
jgi:hypothetical protein